MTDDEFLNDRDIPNNGPRTNAVKFEIRWRNGEYRVTRPGIETMDVVPAEEMAKLERELSAARAELAKYKENLQEMSNDWAASDEKLRAELERAMRVVEAARQYAMTKPGRVLDAVDEWEAGR